MAAHRYYRILFTGPGQNAGQIDLGWVKMFETVDIDATVAANPASVGGTAICGEQYNGTYLPSRAFDYAGRGETADNWASLGSTATYGTTKWLGYDFGAGNPKDIVAYSISYYSIYSPYEWVFQWSDDASAWTTVHTVSGFRFAAATSHYFRCPSAALTGAGYRYWRVKGGGTGSGFAIGEIDMRTTVGGSNILTSPYPSLYFDSLYSNNVSYHPRKAIDGLLNALSYSFMAADNTSEHWWMVDFGKRVDIKQIVMNCGDNSYQRSDIKIQASHDAASWVDQGVFPPFTSGYQQQTLALTVAAAGRRRPVIVSM